MKYMDKTDIYAHSINRLGELMKQHFFSLLGLIMSNIILLTSTFTINIPIFQICIGQRHNERGRKAVSTPPSHTTGKHPLKKT